MQSGNFQKCSMLVWFPWSQLFAVVGGCKKKVASTPPAQTPVRRRAANRNAERVAHHRESRSERKPLMVFHRCDGFEYRSRRWQSGGRKGQRP